MNSANGEAFACASGNQGTLVSYRFIERSIVYSVDKAKNGILEPIWIKKVRLIVNAATYGRVVPLYVDKDNWLWNEEMLCTESDAINFAISYLRGQQQQAQDALEQCL